MKAIILAGGLGTRLSEETALKPKPMVEVGGMPIIWHIMKIYSHHGINDFIICGGYKGYVIKEYFKNYFLHTSDCTFDLRDNTIEIHKQRAEPWRVTIVDTGETTMTGGRLLRLKEYLKKDQMFCLTYGDGVGDIDVKASISFHKSHNKLATLTATSPTGRFGALNLQENSVTKFKEKPKGDGVRVNGGYFVLNTEVLDYIEDDDTSFEDEPLTRLAAENQLMAFQHDGFWQPMDTLRDKNYLENLWQTRKAPWKLW
jgi:glucose-1-phosphate cytidylyltransferase